MVFRVVIVGGGLVGSLAAVYMAEKGCEVHVFEKRPDLRKETGSAGKSINLALSARGIAAIEKVGLGCELKDNMIPMSGRFIHLSSGKTSVQNYGVFGECINSVDRKWVNKMLQDNAELHKNVTLHFCASLESINFTDNTIMFKEDGKNEVLKDVTLVIGCDGAYSRVRSLLMRQIRMDYAQEYIDHAYVELSMPPTSDGEYAMSANHLHIWPRQTFMMIALPNLDKSFTVTLFMPWSKFDAIKSEADLLGFFEGVFPDSIPLLGRDALIKDYFTNEKGSLISVKCKPYHYENKVVLLGDAIHAMVPFYGQGMNCGFEDVLILDEIWRSVCSSENLPTPIELGCILETFSKQRNPDAEAMCDLAMHNYVEMRSSVTDVMYLIRKRVEAFLHSVIPSLVTPLYTMVSFSRIPYAQALAKHDRQTVWFWRGVRFVRICAVIVGVSVIRKAVPYCRRWFLK